VAVSSNILRRYILIAIGATVVMVAGWTVVHTIADAPAGDYAVRQGNILLEDGKFDQAIERFDAALAENPRHPGAMMGGAIAMMQWGRLEQANSGFDRLIVFLIEEVAETDANRPTLLAAAFANRGILHDRAGRPEAALADYRRALAIDPDLVSGPGIVDRVLYGMPDAANVAKRADYLEGQLKLPPEKRQLHRPDIDARQRMHKP
jgi:tetratricopeptide (TPR) repeat protein